MFNLVTSCDKTSGTSNGVVNDNTTETKESNTKDSSVKDIYLDSAVVENDSFKFELKSNYCTSYSSNCSLSLYFDLLNKEYSAKTYTIKNVKLIKVSTNAEYTVNYSKDQGQWYKNSNDKRQKVTFMYNVFAMFKHKVGK